jgi:hypothetical protein
MEQIGRLVIVLIVDSLSPLGLLALPTAER